MPYAKEKKRETNHKDKIPQKYVRLGDLSGSRVIMAM